MLGCVEDQPVLVNVTVMNKDSYFEAVMLRGKSLKKRIFALLGVVIAVIGLLMSSWIVAVLGVLVAILSMFSHLIIGHHDYTKLLYRYPEGEWTKVVKFYDDHIESDTGNGKPAVHSYKDIQREFEGNNMYVIEFGKDTPAMTFCKNSFEKGSISELKSFITEKRCRSYDELQKKDEQEGG